MDVLQLVTTDDRTFFLDQVRALERQGINCDVLAASPGSRSYTDSLGPISRRVLPDPGHNVPYYAVNAAYGYPRILKTVLENDYDLIHVNSGLAAPYGLLQPRRPVVQTFWGSDLMGDYLGGRYTHVCRFCARRFDASIVRNEAMRQQLDTDAHVIPAGVDMQKFKPLPRDEALDHVGWDPETKHVLFPYDPTKRHSKRVDRKNYDLAAAVADRAAEQLEDPLELQTVSGVPHDEMLYYMNAADALLLTSKLEGSPNTVKEAMAHVGWDPETKHVLFPYDPTKSHSKRVDRKNYNLAATVADRAAEQLEEPLELQTVSGVPHDEMIYYMNAADALLLTSKLEGSPNTVKEAMACNLPVVSTDVGDVQTRLEDVSPSAVCTTETELVDALLEVLETGERSNGRTHVEEVSWDRMAENIIQVYENVTA